MIRKNQWLLNTANFIMDVVLILVAYGLAVWFRLDYLTGRQVPLRTLFEKEYVLVACLYAVVIGIAYVAFRLYGSFRFQRFRQEALTIALINGGGILAVGALLYLFRLTDFSRLVLALFYLFSVVLVLGKRLVLRGILSWCRGLGYDQRSLLVVGGSEYAARYMQHIRVNPQYGYRLLGYLAPQPDPESEETWLGEPDKLRQLLSGQPVDQVVFALSGSQLDGLGGMIASCGRYGAKASVIPCYNDFIPATPTVEAAGSLKLINVRSTPDKGPVWAFVKRAMDLCGALIGLVLASPIMLAAAIAVKCCDGGPVIFAQERVGKNGSRFKMYKFRSMYPDAEARLAELQKFNQVDGPAFKMENDPRVTPVGRFIRKTSIDELPQLVNILKGDMSIVGPRPPLPREVAQYSDWDWGRLAVKPGLTCYWQVSGRSDVSFDEWMKLDLKYVEEQGLWTDLKILCKTVAVVLRGDGAY